MTKFIIFLTTLLLLPAQSAFAAPDSLQHKIDYHISQAEFDVAKKIILTNINNPEHGKSVNSLRYQLVKVLFIQSDYHEALEQAFISLDRVKSGEESVNLNFMIGCIYSAIKDYGESVKYFDKVIKETGDSSMMVKVHLLSSELFLELNDSVRAKASLSEAYNISQTYGSDDRMKDHVAMQYNFSQQNYERCKELNLKVIEDSTSYHNAKSYAYSMMGDCLVRQDSLRKSISYFEHFLALTFETKDPEQIKVAADKLIGVYEKLGLQHKANAFHKIYNEAASDSLSFSVEKYRELYDIEKKRMLDSSARQSRAYLIIGFACILLGFFAAYRYFTRKPVGKQPKEEQEESSANKIIVSEAEIKKIETAINLLVVKQLYLTPRITRKAFCEDHDIKSERYLSHYINEEYKKSFSVFINDLRVEYAFDRIQNDSSFRNYRIEEIAKESGFGSKKSFERAFSAKYNATPYKFILQLTP